MRKKPKRLEGHTREGEEMRNREEIEGRVRDVGMNGYKEPRIDIPEEIVFKKISLRQI